VRTGAAGTPALLLEQLVHLVLRHLLAGCDDPIRLSAAELLFREQKVTMQDGAIMLADEETVEMHAAGAAAGQHGLLVAGAALPESVELDVLDEHTAAMYRAHSDRFDTVLDLSFARGPGCPVPGAGGLDPALLGRSGRDSAGPADRRRALGVAHWPG
jgi:hypothetical protein